MPNRYMVAETTDLKTKAKSYKIFERKGDMRVVASGFATRQDAEARLRELEQEEERKP